MKTILSLSALLITLTLTAQYNPATWYLNNTSGNGIQSPTSTASGNFSNALGFQTIASGVHSTAMGNQTTASGKWSTAMGYDALASGDGSLAAGIYVNASGVYSTAVGLFTTSSGYGSTAIGDNTTASGFNSTSMGIDTEASGDYSTAMGFNSNAIGMYSVAIGATNNSTGYASTTLGDANLASGRASTAIGAGTIAEDYGMFTIGSWSKALDNPSPELFSYTNTAFLIGNGADADNRSNAVQILFDGTTTIAGDLSINSDARLKANIISLGSTLAKLLQIDGKTYTMKKDENKKQKIGVLAQDIEKVFPELVSESNGVKSVNYQGLVPVLINALKEQQAEIDRLKTQEKRLDRLERLVAAMN